MKPFLLRTAAVIPVYFGLLLGLYQTSSQEVNCSVGWIENGSSCYSVYNDTEQKLTFWEAKRWCKQRGHSCQLTSVLSQEENDFLDYLINETHLRPNETFYIGLKKNNNQGKWRWIDDQPYNYTNWFQGQEPPPESKGNCAFYKGDVHQWGQELKCSKTQRLFICKQQKHSVVESVINSSQENISSSTPVKLTLTTIASPTFVNSTQLSPTVLLQLREQWTVEKLNELLASLEGASFTDESAERLTKELAAVLDGLLNTSQTETKSQSVAQITKVIEMSEKIGKFIVEGLKRGGNVTEPKNIQIQTRNLALGVDILPPASSANTTESVSFPQDNRTANKINLPPSLLWKAQQSDGVSITSLLLPNIGVSKDPQAKRILNSGIISSTILFNNGSKFNNLREPVTINLSTVKEGKGEGSRHCVFLDITTNPPSWSSFGCVVHHQSASHTECHCYHMTSYAVLMDVHGAYESDVISEENELALSTVSIVGCLIAFVCYIILLCTFYFLRRRTETSSIHMNLAAAESFAIFFFLVAYPAVSIKEACFAIAVLLYYFQLASFCWMLVEGINLLRGLVKVFRVTSRLRIYCLFAWGLPVLLAVVIPGVFRHQYLRDNFCWISHQLIWAFAGPVAFILAVNLSVLIVAIKIVVRRARYKVKPNENNKMPGIQLEIRAAFKTTIILVPLLGVTWLLGFISIHEESLVFQYLFAVINSMQGVYFLIAQYCFDDDIKKNAYQASTRMKRLFSLSSTKSTGSSSDRRSRTFSDKKSGSVMRPNLVSPQKSTGRPENNADGFVIAKNRSHEDNFELSLQGMENQQNKEGIADGDNDEDLFDCPQQSAEDQPNIERELVPPQESSSDNNKEKNFPYRQESSAYQQTDEDQQNSEETSICPQHSIADRKDNQKENFLFHKKILDDHQTDGENFDPTRQVTVEQQVNKETSGGPQQSNVGQGKDANDFAGQQDNQDNSVPPSSAAQWDNEGKVRSQSTANEDKNKNTFSPHEEQQHQQYNKENLPSHCQNEPDQWQQSNEESLVSAQPTNHRTDQRKDQNDTVVTRF